MLLRRLSCPAAAAVRRSLTSCRDLSINTTCFSTATRFQAKSTHVYGGGIRSLATGECSHIVVDELDAYLLVAAVTKFSQDHEFVRVDDSEPSVLAWARPCSCTWC